MEQQTEKWMSIAVVVLLIFSVLQTITLISHKQQMSPEQKTSGTAETYEQMMARMHPDQVIDTQSSNQMVGGC